eukprot:m.175454 g.175454  ORF g.175454 m.175454 type:complete len:368 (-) comp13995_c0_seq1:37-1140(-)
MKSDVPEYSTRSVPAWTTLHSRHKLQRKRPRQLQLSRKKKESLLHFAILTASPSRTTKSRQPCAPNDFRMLSTTAKRTSVPRRLMHSILSARTRNPNPRVNLAPHPCARLPARILSMNHARKFNSCRPKSGGRKHVKRLRPLPLLRKKPSGWNTHTCRQLSQPSNLSKQRGKHSVLLPRHRHRSPTLSSQQNAERLSDKNACAKRSRPRRTSSHKSLDPSSTRTLRVPFTMARSSETDLRDCQRSSLRRFTRLKSFRQKSRMPERLQRMKRSANSPGSSRIRHNRFTSQTALLPGNGSRWPLNRPLRTCAWLRSVGQTKARPLVWSHKTKFQMNFSLSLENRIVRLPPLLSVFSRICPPHVYWQHGA